MTEALHPRAIRALVVDDSAVARKVLTSILHREGLEVDMAVSAEDALEFLTGHRPDVIFMDHTMPGMDGFEALKAIKANPKTATIPVMMFTSQSGEVYLSQARALGAIDVLQKDSLADIDISARLQELGVFHAPVKTRKANMALIENKTSARQRELATLIRLLVREEFARFKEDFPVMLKQHQHILDEPDPRSPPEWQPEPAARPGFFSRYGGWLVLGILGTYLIGWQLGKRANEFDTEAAVTTTPAASVVVAPPSAAASPATALAPDTLNLISWALGDKMYYSPEEAPLSGDRQQRIETLLNMLVDSRFTGVVQLTVHQGRFCVETNDHGEQQLAAPTTPVDQCTMLAGDIDSTNARLMSLPFAMFIESSPLANGERGIQLDVEVAGEETPAVAYPEGDSTVLAQTWNQIASLNNRVEIKLMPMPGL